MGNLTRSERLDQLPYTRQHHRLLMASGVGWALDAMDIGLISFIMVALVQEWTPSDLQLSLLGSIGFVGMAVGASVGGLLADRIGRRQVFALTMLIYGLATGLSAVSTGLVVLLALRFVVGLGLGAELPVASTLVSEFAPTRIRGRIVVALESFWALGWLAAALIGYFVIPHVDGGWRWALALGALPAAWSLIIRYGLPESVRFLESQGRNREAEATVTAFEESPPAFGAHSTVPAPAAHGSAPVAADIAAPEPGQNESRWNTLLSPRFRRTTIALSLVWLGVNFSYYGAFIWLPTLLHQGGMDVVKSFEFVLFMTLAQLPGYLLAAILVEKWGRRATLIAFLAGSALSALIFGLSPVIAQALWPDNLAAANATALACACALSFCNLGAWGALYALTPEVFPTFVRATGAGAATAVGRIAAMLAPLLVPVINNAGGLVGLFMTFGAMFGLAALAAVFLPEFRGKVLEAR